MYKSIQSRVQKYSWRHISINNVATLKFKVEMKSSHDSASVGMPNLSELSIFGTVGCCDDMTGFCMVVSVAASTFTFGTLKIARKVALKTTEIPL